MESRRGIASPRARIHVSHALPIVILVIGPFIPGCAPAEKAAIGEHTCHRRMLHQTHKVYRASKLCC